MLTPSIRRILKAAFAEPLVYVGALWSLVMLTPFASRLPMPPALINWWRQDFAFALLLCLSLCLFARKFLNYSADIDSPPGAPSRWRFNRIDLCALAALACFIIWSAASSMWATNGSVALLYAAKWLGFTLFFLLARQAVRKPKIIFAALCVLGAVTCVFGVTFLIDAWVAPQTTANSLMGFGEPQAVIVPLFVALALRVRRFKLALVCALVSALAWATMLEMMERAPLLAACAGLGCIAIGSLVFKQHRPRSLSRVCLVATLLLVTTALQLAPSYVIAEREQSYLVAKLADPTNHSASVRLLLWRAGFEMLAQHPVQGVGANNYEGAFPGALRDFAVTYSIPESFREVEVFIAQRAHNEYLQMLAELGIVGFTFFLLFCAALIVAAWRALRRTRSPLALGATCSLVTFAISSGATSASFRWFAGGLLFFFLAALIFRLAADSSAVERATTEKPAGSRASGLWRNLSFAPGRAGVFACLLCAFAFGIFAAVPALTGMFCAQAFAATNDAQAETLFQRALAINSGDHLTHNSYGVWLLERGRYAEAAAHLQTATERGFNNPAGYSKLAAAYAAAGDLSRAASVMRYASEVYPRSLYTRVRYACALMEAGDTERAVAEYRLAEQTNARAARSWWYLINFGREVAGKAAHYDKDIAMPGELLPEPLIHVAISDHDFRPTSLPLPNLRSQIDDQQTDFAAMNESSAK